MIFRLIQILAIILFLIYYGTILIEVFTNREVSFTNHDLNDWHVWIPFYLWFTPSKK